MNTPNLPKSPQLIDHESAGKLPEEAAKRIYSKGDSRYWRVAGRLFKDHGVADFSCRFSYKGKRAQVCLNTSNQWEAARKAADLYTSVTRDGWTTALANYRPEEKVEAKHETTVGELIDAATKLLSARPQTILAYSQAFRCMVAEIKGIKGANKTSPGKGGNAEWKKQIDAVSLSAISPAEIVAWKNDRLRASQADALAKRRSVVTVNAIIRNGKALFGKKILPFLSQSLSLPDPLPFSDIKLEKAPSRRYISQIDPFAILALAKKELADSKPPVFTALVLALVCGLRRSEIDNLLWRAFDFQNAVLKIESTEFHELKSEDSAGAIDLDPETLALFKKLRAVNPTSQFVIESAMEPKKKKRVGGDSYRCNRVFVELIAWLKEKGVNTQKPIHTLRKEIGSIIAAEHGIFEASRYLRHSDIQITAAIYTDKKKIVTPKIFSGIL